ncbi:MAG TPA: hypothetical protein VID94_08270 [Acidimicrobiales bacterium]
MRARWAALAAVALLASACSGGDDSAGSDATGSDGSPAPAEATAFQAGAASRSVLPTVDGERAYLDEAPAWNDYDPDDPGVFVPTWDQGQVDVGNGSDDGSWVHDDLRASAVALSTGEDLVVIVSVDVYMVFAVDAAEIERRARELLPADVADRARIIISATHVHEGPDTAFSVNDDWYDLMADETAGAIADAVDALQPAELTAAQGEHGFGQVDARDPLIVDPTVNVLSVKAAESDETIATVVQWASHPETTLGWSPPVDLTEACAAKGWTGEDCTADGRYFTADYPGVLRTRLQEHVGGEVVYLNGAIGSQIGPGDADVWRTDAVEAVDGPSVAPAGAEPVDGAADFREQNFARTDAIGTELFKRVAGLLDETGAPLEPTISWDEQAFYTRLTNIGFRVLLADGDLGWQDPPGYTCTGRPFSDDTCTDDGGEVEDDPILTPLVDSQIRVGDVLQTRLVFVDVGGVGFLFMPGELPPELVVGLPEDFDDTATYYAEPALHATGDDYAIPGALLDLVPTEQTFTVGLGGDELGYFVPINETRLKCLDLALPPEAGYSCQRLFDEGLLITPDAVAGPVCREMLEDPEATDLPTGDARTALEAVCRYGQALGRELGEPDGHYEETNSAGWDLVDDTWAAAEQLFRP